MPRDANGKVMNDLLSTTGLIFPVMRCEHPVEPIHKLLLKTFCRVYQLCQLAPGSSACSHKTICVCGHQARDTGTGYMSSSQLASNRCLLHSRRASSPAVPRRRRFAYICISTAN
ncbi:unnamed protein product [Pleuronectes platessa]|uniref:Uncharacterized protein n=1 Tax=Pleuronectes platessa TaxID=8262 RepID=A0A9N7UAA0_PLEPL|nr:unnamed protein product [Pleuronectes platessa]